MNIIRQTPHDGGAYPSIQSGNFSAVPAGCALWLADVPTEDFYKYSGFVTLEISEVDGVSTVTSCVPNLDAWESWKASLPPEEPEAADVPTEAEQVRADVDYLAAMMGVTL